MADPPVGPDELQRLGLYDPDAPDADARLELIEYLLGLGVTLDDVQGAAYGDLPALASTIALRGRPTLTVAELAAEAGTSEALARRVLRALGLPDPDPAALVGTDEDVQALRTLVTGISLLGEEEMLQLARVIGSSLSRIADAMVSTFIVNVAAPSIADDPSGLALARANAEAGVLLRSGGAAIDYLLRRHIEIAQRPLVQGVGETQPLAVGFVDLVGSTALAQRVSIGELGSLLAAFDRLASDVIITGGARLVKLIGDEVMFVATDPSAACKVALDLEDQQTADPRLPDGRAALAYGDVLTRDGDYFGPVVNVAARAVKFADPGAVLAAQELAQKAADSYRVISVGAQTLKGFDEPVELFRVERRSR